MKKKFSIFGVLAVILCSCFLFFGCGPEPTKYNVKATIWYASYGSVEGSGTYEEDSTCTLVAKPKQNSTFLAWMKNNVVVSYESSYSFKVSNETSGDYVAIFTLPSLDLVSPKSFEFKTTMQDFTSCNLVLKIGTSYEYLNQVYSGEVTNEGQYGFEDVVLALPYSNKIICEANFTVAYYTVIEDEEIEASATTKTYLEIELEDLLASNLQLLVPSGIAGTATISIGFDNFTVVRPDTEPEESVE